MNEASYQDISFEWDTSGKEFDDSEEAVYAVVDIHDGIEEYDEENNAGFCQVRVTNIADFTDDGEVGYPDLAALAEEWLATENLSADIEPDGGDDMVNFLDYAKLADNWLESVNY